MSDKIFVDSNIWLYLLGDDLSKKIISLKLLLDKPKIIVQVLKENANTCLKKFRLSTEETKIHIEQLVQYCKIAEVGAHDITEALSILEKYHFSFYDSLIITVALRLKCTTLFSEDMHDGQTTEGTLKIINPFSSGIKI